MFSSGRLDGYVPLSEFMNGEKGIVKIILGGRGLCNRLYSIGIVPGAKIRVISAIGGPILIEVNETRLALGRGMASKILVRRV